MQPQSKYSKFTLIFLTIVCIIQSATIAYCSVDYLHTRPRQDQVYESNPEPVNVCIIDKQSFTGYVYTYGQIKARNQLTYKSPSFQSYTPKVHAIHFQAGQRVKEGELLLELKCPEMLLRCQALFKEAEQKKILYEKLLSLKSASSTYETNKALCEYEKALLEAQAMQETSKYLTIKAPFSGTMSNCEINLQEMITDAHKPLFSIYDQDNLTVEFYIDNNDLVYLDFNTRIVIQSIDNGNNEQQIVAEAIVYGINPCIDEQTGKVKVMAAINKAYLTGLSGSHALKHNMHVYIYFDKTPLENVYVVTKSALIEDGSGYTYVRKIVNNNGIDEMMLVKSEVLDHNHNIYAIKSEQLRNGDQIIIEGGSKRDGTPVIVKKIYDI